MPRRVIRSFVGLSLTATLLLTFAGCRRDDATQPAVVPAASSNAKAKAPTAATGLLQDVVERDPRYMIGISYPPVASKYPALAIELKRYADAARGELMQAVGSLGQGKPTAPYDLSLSFTEVAVTPELVVVAADGSS